MSNKKSFVLYDEYSRYFAQLSMEERGQLITALFAYNSSKVEPTDLSPSAFMAFSFMRDQLDRDLEKYAKRIEQNRINGALGGRPKKTTGFSEKPKKPYNDTDTNTDTDTDTDTENETDTETDSEAAARLRIERILNIPLKTGYNPEVEKYFKAARSK